MFPKRSSDLSDFYLQTDNEFPHGKQPRCLAAGLLLIFYILARSCNLYALQRSDSGQPSHEFVPGMRSFFKTLLAQGVSRENIKIMSHDVPMKICGIK